MRAASVSRSARHGRADTIVSRPRSGRLLLVTALAGLALFLFASDVHAGACARMAPMVMVVPDATDVLPLELGVLVTIGGPNGRPLGPAHLGARTPTPGRDAFDISAELVQGTTHVALRIEPLAPSLARLVPVTPVTEGEWTLVHGTTVVPVRFGAVTLPALPAAPELRRLRTDHETSSGPRGSSSWTTVTARLRHGMPDGALGAIVFVADSPTAETAQLFAVLEDHSESITLATLGGRCSFTPPGINAPYAGSSATLAWFDRYGRVGARSRAVTVRGH
jgi:hypothetical protein